MPLQILDWGPTPGSQVATGLGSGFSQGMQALANMKMQEYAQRQQASRTQSALEQYGIPKEQAQAVSQMDPAMQQAYFKNYLQAPQNEAYANAWTQLLGGGQQPTMPETGMKALMGTPENIPSFEGMSREQIEKLGPIALTEQYRQKKLASETAQKTRKQELEEASKITPFIKTEQSTSGIIRDVGKDARRIKQILERHKKDWPSWAKRTFQGATGGMFILDPEMKEFSKLTSALPVKLGNALRGQPTNMKIKLVAEGKPDISSPWETNMQLVQHLIDADEEDKKRTLFRVKQKKNGNYPVDIDQKMADYDAAINSPEEYPEFFEKYPQFQPKIPGKASKPVTPEIKVGAKLDKLPPASEYPGMEGLWNGKKVKSDGKSWRAA